MLIQEFHDLIRNQNFATANSLIVKAKELKYPGTLIEYMEIELNRTSGLTIVNPISEHLEEKELPDINLDNYLLYREDLRHLGLNKEQVERHLFEYGIDELIKEEESYQYKIRRYFDLNDSLVHEFAILVVHSGQHKELEYISRKRNNTPVFDMNLDDLLVHVKEIDTDLDIQEFAAWLSLRKKISYLCILDESDRPIEGWQDIIRTYLKQNHEIVFTEEYVASNGNPRHTKRNRQYKSHPSLFRIFTRGYISGVFAVRTALLSRLKTVNTNYFNTWCLQVDITQQAMTIPLVVDIPLMVRNQELNSALLEYGDIRIRNEFQHACKSFLNICKNNLGTSQILTNDYPAKIQQGQLGEIIFKPKKDIKKFLLSIIIPFRDKIELLKQCIESLQMHETLISYEIILADNGSVEMETQIYIKNLISKSENTISHIYIDEPFNYSRINNIAAEHAHGDFLLLLNNDIEFCAANPLSRMAAYFAFDQVGAVGATLLFPDLSIQHAGIVLTPFETYDTFCPYRTTLETEYDSYQTSMKSAEEWSAVTAACLLVRKEVWQALNGMNETLTVAYNDVDFCLRVRELGKSVISIPDLKIKHYESKSRGDDCMGYKYNRLYKESGILRSQHTHYLSSCDPFWSKMLSVSNPRGTAGYHDRPEILNQKCETGIILRDRGLRDPLLKHYCVYVGFDSQSRLRPDVLEQIQILSQYYNIVYVTTSHRKISNDPLFASLKDLTYKILIRNNVGYDFGSWRAGILELEEEIKDCESILLINDSLYGPINSLEAVIDRAVHHESDIVCMTKNMVGGQHAQSYFVSYKKSVVESKLFTTFWKTLPVYGSKFSLIKECEINWSQELSKAGYKLSALFDTGTFGNQTHINWKELIEVQGFPFVKNELIQHNPVGQNLDGIDEILQRNPQLYSKMLSYWKETQTSIIHLKR